jgi:hypothetical protein
MFPVLRLCLTGITERIQGLNILCMGVIEHCFSIKKNPFYLTRMYLLNDTFKAPF